MSQKTDRWKTRKAGSFMFTYAVLSEVGEREINEDSVGFAPVGKDIGIVILADGLGGQTGFKNNAGIAANCKRLCAVGACR